MPCHSTVRKKTIALLLLLLLQPLGPSLSSSSSSSSSPTAFQIMHPAGLSPFIHPKIPSLSANLTAAFDPRAETKAKIKGDIEAVALEIRTMKEAGQKVSALP